MFDFGGMMGGGGGHPAGMIASKIINGIQGMGEKPMSPEDFARLQGGIIGGQAPAPAPTPAPAQEKSGGGGGSPASGFMGMLGKGVGNLDSTGGSSFLEQAKNLIGGMFK